MKQYFLSYCDIFLASQTRTNVGQAWFCPLGIDWMVVDCYWWISCEWQVGPTLIIREEKSQQHCKKYCFFNFNHYTV